MVSFHEIKATGNLNVFDFLSSERARDLAENVRMRASEKMRDYWGDDFVDRNRHFKTFLNVIKKEREVGQLIIDSCLDRSAVPDNIVAIDTAEKLLGGVPDAMFVYILMSPVLRQALINDEIYGFGLKPSDIPSYDVLGKRLFHNGRVDPDHPINKSFMRSTDPDLSIKEQIALRNTRDFFEHLYHCGYDPTDFPNKVCKIK